MKRWVPKLFWVLLLTNCLLLAPLVQAANQPGGVTITPASQQLVLSADQSLKQFNLEVTNNTNSDLTFKVSAVDFNALDESGGVAFVGPSGGDSMSKYGLASWIDFASSQLTVASHTQGSLVVMIRNDTTLAAGGHYGAILLAAQAPDQTTASNQVGLKQTLSVPVFVTKQGGERYDLRLNRAESSTSRWQLPSQLYVRFYNPGNTQVVPRGIVSLVDPRGKTVSKGIINPASGIILPETFRRYSVQLQALSSPWLIGRYSLVVQYRYDGFDQFATKTSSFYFLAPLWVDGVALGLTLGLIAGVFWLIRRKRRLAKVSRTSHLPQTALLPETLFEDLAVAESLTEKPQNVTNFSTAATKAKSKAFRSTKGAASQKQPKGRRSHSIAKPKERSAATAKTKRTSAVAKKKTVTTKTPKPKPQSQATARTKTVKKTAQKSNPEK